MPSRRLSAWLIYLAAASPAFAHDFTITDALVIIKANGTYQIDLTLDIDALAMNVPPRMHTPELIERLRRMDSLGQDAALSVARQAILARFAVEFDGHPAVPHISFPDRDAMSTGATGSIPPIAAATPSVFGVTARLSGLVPTGAREFAFGGSADAGVIQLTIIHQGSASGVKHLLSAGSRSPGFPLDASARPQQSSTGPPPVAHTVVDYFILGFEHIVPRGLDHILFVLGLFLFSASWRPLLIQVSAFTVAHTLTLALSIYGIVQLPSRLVETVIALSIAYVAIENILATTLTAWRPALVFVFGLLHGMGFAGVLRELGLPRGQFVPALISFNVGVEAGQLSVIALAALTVGWFRNRTWFRHRILIPASVAIAGVGLYWAVERAIG